jgi:hypothetical protein
LLLVVVVVEQIVLLMVQVPVAAEQAGLEVAQVFLLPQG